MATLCLMMAIVSFIVTVIFLFCGWRMFAIAFAVITLLEAWQYCIWRHKAKMSEKGRPKFEPFSKKETE
jgi:membrane protein implicated in regulation of membrane protease activity